MRRKGVRSPHKEWLPIENLSKSEHSSYGRWTPASILPSPIMILAARRHRDETTSLAL